jgi:hypothetical protein
MALMPDEDFEGDFLEVQENNHGITLQVRLERRNPMVELNRTARNVTDDQYCQLKCQIFIDSPNLKQS